MNPAYRRSLRRRLALISGGAAITWALIACGFGAFEVCRIAREQSLNRLMAETEAAAQKIAQAPPDSELIEAALGALARQRSISSITLKDGAKSRTLASDKAPIRDGWLDERFKADWALSVQARARPPVHRRSCASSRSGRRCVAVAGRRIRESVP